MSLLAPDCWLLTADGRSVAGAPAVRDVLAESLGQLRSSAHAVTNEWHQRDVWIAEVEATYELQDWLKFAAARAFFARVSPHGIVEMRVYGAHERPLSEHAAGHEGIVIGGRRMPPL